jgi:maltose alpha-D-glucosyltransferase/alpha-amylase
LVDGDRRRIELLNGLLFSMPGTPIIYYGDEIGMGDNPFLGDRDVVRTPMQWSPDRNAGFSGADAVALYLPPVIDPLFGFAAVNVDTQRKIRSSLLNWMRWLLAVRKRHPAFGRGDFSFLRPENRRVLAYLRCLGDEVLLCVANLSETPQAAEIDLTRFSGLVPVELFGGSTFPEIGSVPYLLTLAGHSFLWLELVPAREAAGREQRAIESKPGLRAERMLPTPSPG